MRKTGEGREVKSSGIFKCSTSFETTIPITPRQDARMSFLPLNRAKRCGKTSFPPQHRSSSQGTRLTSDGHKNLLVLLLLPPPGLREPEARRGGRRRQKLPGSGRMEGVKTRGGGAAGAGAGLGEPSGCGCKGIRSCLLCEAAPPPQKSANFVYCPLTGFAVGEKQSEFEGWAFEFPGVFLLEDFINTDEEYQMVELMDQSIWKPSQSGRRKQDYGPKVNFKKQKMKAGNFSGLPSFSKEIVARMRKYPILESFSPVEQCNLDYDPERGSAIDPHWDDWWLWGERLRSLVVLSGPARYQWKHAIYRNHIKSRRVCITFRELTAEFSLGGEQAELGKNLLDIALTFKGSPV
ncbi:alpha-ketoglutarate-dependent dioxygenase alkB 4 [Crotalus adamanteus]|uniref:Alpha-ketoglutarate-dependent dioxygenase alkB 4 n=1 Tax=Crotalus adamanteus TaxID=8729 RepID=A0AAW1CEM1_CROAD